MTGFFTLTRSNVKSAIIYGLLTLASSFALAVLQSVLDARSIFGLDWKFIVNNAVIATIPLMIVGISIFKNLLTDSKGKFLGSVEVIPDKGVTEKQ